MPPSSAILRLYQLIFHRSVCFQSWSQLFFLNRQLVERPFLFHFAIKRIEPKLSQLLFSFKKDAIFCFCQMIFIVTGMSWFASCKALCSRREYSPVPRVEGVRIVLMRLNMPKRSKKSVSFAFEQLQYLQIKSQWVCVKFIIDLCAHIHCDMQCV